jgi:hypothetical protein
MDVRRDGWMVGEDGKGGRTISMFVRAGGRIIPEGDGERQQVPLGWAPRVVDQKAAKPSVEAFVFAKDLVWANRIRSEGDGKRDHERWVLGLRHEFVSALHDPVGELVDVLAG